ncbi:MAG: hypothetical protein QOC71_71 [Thermoplasmata archaeon]|nr:hypothetical protein [Thermoplasmata archaeon]
MTAAWDLGPEAVPPPKPGLPWPVVIAATFLASLSGLVLILYVYAGLPLRFSGPFIAFPAGLLTLGFALFFRNRHAQLRRLAQLVLVGTIVGFAATVAYDVVRIGVKELFGFHFDPFRAQRMFGSLMFGVDPDSSGARLAGWLYHFLNGTNFAVIFTLLRPMGGLWWGLLWSLTLEGFMLLVYPKAVEISPDVGFMTISVLGHIAWGTVLGLGVRHWSPDRPRITEALTA